MPFEILTGFVTAPGTTLTALTMATGDVLTVRESVNPRLLNAWVDAQQAGTPGSTFRIRSPLMHDAVQGLRVDVVASEVEPLFPMGTFQPLVKQDTLTVELAGSSTSGDIETACLMLGYDSVPGSEGRWIDEAMLRQLAVQPVTVENTLALGTGGGYSGEEAINSEFDLLKADFDYALIGFEVSVECAGVFWRGSDTGNLRIGGPGHAERKMLTGNWFSRISREYAMPMIPVFNVANKAAIFLDGAQDENGTDVTVTSHLMQLTPEARKIGADTPGPQSATGRSTARVDRGASARTTQVLKPRRVA